MDLLEIFSSRNINLSRIESRPMKKRLGQYCFFIDAVGHIEDSLMGGAIRSLSRQDVDVKFLGSYANAGPPAAAEPARVTRQSPATPWKPVERVGVCGLGLIGGSLAYALGMVEGVRVTGYDPDIETSLLAASGGIRCVSSLKELVESSELIVAAPPMSAIPGLFDSLAPLITPAHIVTDVGSVKAPVLDAARRAIGHRAPFIGGHPMAGSERSGHAAARADLFRNSAWVMTFDDGTAAEPFLRLTELLLRLDARVIPMTADQHDASVALISHAQHALAYTVMSMADESAARSVLFDLAAGSFRGAVRVAGASATAWAQICADNKRRVSEVIGGLIDRLSACRTAIEAGEAVRLFEKGANAHKRFLHDSRNPGDSLISLPCSTPDFVRALAEIQRRSARIERMEIDPGSITLRTSVREF